MKRIFSIIVELGLGLLTGTIAFWGTLVPRILTVDYTFNPFDPDFTIVIFIHYKSRIAVAIHDL